MVVLHIANINDNMCNGVCIVVPQHVKAQGQYETVGFINITGYRVEGLENQFDYREPFLLSQLPEPFCNPDLVVFHEVYRPQYLKISEILRKKKIPYVIIPHGELTAGAQKKKWFKKKVANFLLFNRFIKKAAAIQCLSDAEMKNTHFRNKKIVQTNGIPIPLEHKETFSDSGLKVLYIGRLDMYHKGLDLLFSAVEKIRASLRESHCKLYIYGPDYKGSLERMRNIVAENGMEDIVTLNCAVTGQEKTDELLSADCFIQTSRFEGMPMGILEAMSYGLPCIVTEGTSIDKIANAYSAGWTCKTNAESIADALRRALNEKNLLAEKSQNAIRAVKENFTWDKIAKDTLEQYAGLIGLNGRS